MTVNIKKFFLVCHMDKFLISISLVLLTGCGGGGGSSSSSSSNEYTFDLTNKVAQAYSANCSNGIVTAEYKFSKDGIQFLRGTDSVIENLDGTCSAKQTARNEVGVVFSYSTVKNDGFLIPCGGPKCTLAQLNATYSGTDVDNRSWTQVVSHTANTNEIVSTKTWFQNIALNSWGSQ